MFLCSLIGCVAVSVFSCKTPFSTREPENPSTEQSSWIQPTSPAIVLVNLRNALSEKNVTNYMRCLADTGYAPRPFRYVADPAVANSNPGLFDNWGYEREQVYINQLKLFLPKDSTSALNLTPLSETPTQQDSAVFIQAYHLVVNYKCDQPECFRILDGQAEFRFVRNNEDLWYIHRWEDKSTGDNPTWSVLRAYFGK